MYQPRYDHWRVLYTTAHHIESAEVINDLSNAEDEIRRLQGALGAMAERVHAQSELLSKKAELPAVL